MNSPCAFSIVIPVYNEQAVLPLLFQELDPVCDEIVKLCGPVEVLLINDGSADRSWELVKEQCQRSPRYVGINLSRNFGHQLALAAGLETARGEVVVTMDADLQDPPDVILQMLKEHQRGFDVVYATRLKRGEEPFTKRVTARFFYFLINKLSGVRIASNTGDFRLISRRALAELVRLRETHRFLRGLVPWIGFPQTQVYYDRADRAAGETHYPFRKMLLLALDGIASMSTTPLRFTYLISLSLFAIFIGYVIYVVLNHFLNGSELVPGWTSIMSSITIFGTIQMLLLGVFGEYLGRIYEQTKNRPLFIIQEIVHTDERP